jgi:hypothetical protein
MEFLPGTSSFGTTKSPRQAGIIAQYNIGGLLVGCNLAYDTKVEAMISISVILICGRRQPES